MSDKAATFKNLLARVAAGEALEAADAEAAFDAMMSGEVSQAQMAAFLTGLRVRGETVEEITGAARIMRAKAHTVSAPEGAVDTCGTGGDASGTFNISTAAALVVAGAGVPVAKHGNRAQSSRSGSADLLNELGVGLDADLMLVEDALREAGFGFLMAPRHHSAMKHVAPVRKELGFRTLFNLLGPLANPAGTQRQVIGVFDRRWVEPMAHVLGNLGCERAWVVHGSDGLDELTTTGTSYVAELKPDGTVESFTVTPSDAGLATASLADLAGGEARDNAATAKALLDGATGPIRDIVVLNAAAALVVAGAAENLADGARKAEAALDDGRARAVLERLVHITQAGAPAS